ncbi:MAG: (d)CMP kinase [Firmicutes bacterium]|nr:(d)CMP kinase [Bacillota bacterium]
MVAKQIAIDGPAGAGKSTVAKALAARLGYLYIDTGAMYRCIAWLALQQGIDLSDEAALTALAETARVDLVNGAGGYRVYCNDQDVSEEIRRPQVGAAASPVSAVDGVRRALVRQQQALAARGCVVMDGRDIGTKVLPHAQCKIFLTAPLSVRAARRASELRDKGLDVDISQIEAEIAERDRRDSTRANSPLIQAADAIYVDTGDMTVEQVIDHLLQLAKQGE